MKVDAAAAGEVGSMLDSGDPTKIFKSFGATVLGVKFAGSQTIGGEKLDRYDVTVDTAKTLRLQGKPVPAGVPKTITYSLWLDSAHRVRRLTFDLSGVSMVMTLSEFNQPVAILAPPASKVVTR